MGLCSHTVFLLQVTWRSHGRRILPRRRRLRGPESTRSSLKSRSLNAHLSRHDERPTFGHVASRGAPDVHPFKGSAIAIRRLRCGFIGRSRFFAIPAIGEHRVDRDCDLHRTVGGASHQHGWISIGWTVKVDRDHNISTAQTYLINRTARSEPASRSCRTGSRNRDRPSSLSLIGRLGGFAEELHDCGPIKPRSRRDRAAIVALPSWNQGHDARHMIPRKVASFLKRN